MKKFLYLCILMSATVFVSSCENREEITQEMDLYSIMEQYSQHFNSVYNLPLGNQTKADISTTNDGYPDIGALDDKFIGYIDFYTRSNNISEWDEHEVLELISNDSEFTPDEKLFFAQSISFAYYIKTTSNPTDLLTKTADDCYEAYSKASRRALRRAVATLLVGMLEPTPAGEALAVAMYAIEMSEAEEDYYECLRRQ